MLAVQRLMFGCHGLLRQGHVSCRMLSKVTKSLVSAGLWLWCEIGELCFALLEVFIAVLAPWPVGSPASLPKDEPVRMTEQKTSLLQGAPRVGNVEGGVIVQYSIV